MNEVALLKNYLAVGGLLFSIGLIGFLVRRNLIVMFLCAEMMLQGISVSLIAWGRFHGDWGGQMLVGFNADTGDATVGAASAAVPGPSSRTSNSRLAGSGWVNERSRARRSPVRSPVSA